MPSSFPDVPLRSTSFALQNRWLLWPRARLYSDRLELTGWELWRHYHRSLPLASIDEAEPADSHLVLHLSDGSSLWVLMDTPGQWASAIETYRDVRENSG